MEKNGLIVLKEQGSFAVGGSVITSPGEFNPYTRTPEGQTFHGDHAYIFYQIPDKARKLPLALWHGFGQFSKTWETTPDGRDGFQNIFLKRKFGVYLIDQHEEETRDAVWQKQLSYPQLTNKNGLAHSGWEFGPIFRRCAV